MTKSRWVLLFGIGLAVQLIVARWVTVPGYMDADYYYATGRQLYAGDGFQEPFLWNYLDDPTGIPHPSHLYWMPLPSIVAAGGMALFGGGFSAAQVPFLLISAALPVVAAAISLRLTDDRRQAMHAGLLAAFPGFFLPFFATTDAFAIYAVVGGAALWRLAAASRSGRARDWLIAGLLIGISSLIRADAPLLLLAGLPLLLPDRVRAFRNGALLIIGFSLTMAPWWLRNLAEVGAVMNPGSVRVFWMLEYNDLFSYPADQLTFDRWWSAGLGAAITARLQAALVNLQRLIAENGLVFLGPFMLIGVIRRWKQPIVRAAAYYLGLLLVAMTFVFPFVGARGAFFHSSTAVMPILWALTPLGVQLAVEWLGSKRGWSIAEAQRILGAGAVALAATLTVGLFAGRQILPPEGWNASAVAYESVADSLPAFDNAVVAVNNPPGFHLYCGCDAVSIPNGDPSALHQLVERYGIRWVVLDANHPAGLRSLYERPDSVEWLSLMESVSAPNGGLIHIFEVDSS
jgi:hypothetical protein